MSAPSGMETEPRASEMPHSRPPRRVTAKTTPPTKTMRIWTAASGRRIKVSAGTVMPMRAGLTDEGDSDEVRVLVDAFEDVQLPV